MKLDEMMGYFRDGKINLIPPFQRGRVWDLSQRRKLLENIVRAKPIPAIFLYKDEAGSRYSYNILDGKQRLESILLFIGNERSDLNVPNWRDYFFKGSRDAHFKINIATTHGDRAKNRSFSELDDDLVRELREYSIPTIEIDMNKDEGGLAEIIDLFIDINQQGVKVSRFDIVRTMYEENKLLANVFRLVAIKQKRKSDYFYKMINSDFTTVLKYLQSVQVLVAGKTKQEREERQQERVDRIWERLLEVVLFLRTKQHRTLSQILRAFIGEKVDKDKITSEEMRVLRSTFKFLGSVYSVAGVKKSKMAMDQPHFYTMITSIMALDLLKPSTRDELKRKLIAMSQIVDGKVAAPSGKAKILKEYMELSSKQTTHPGRRGRRQEIFVEILTAV